MYRASIINPRRACAVGLLWSIGWSVCLSVCLSVSHLTPGAYFILKMLSRTQQAMEVKQFVGFSDTAPLQRSSTPSVERPYVQSAIFLWKARMCMGTRVLHFSAFVAYFSIPHLPSPPSTVLVPFLPSSPLPLPHVVPQEKGIKFEEYPTPAPPSRFRPAPLPSSPSPLSTGKQSDSPLQESPGPTASPDTMRYISNDA